MTGTANNRARNAKTVPVDRVTTIQNRTMSEWGTNYLQTMAEAQAHAQSQTTLAEARRNAEFWILAQGVAEISQFAGEEFQHPFTQLTGQQLLDAIREPTPPPTPGKRARSGEDEDNEDQQSKRQRSSLIQGNIDDDAAIMLDEEPTYDTTIEAQVGRGQVAPMTERSDSMPWNVYASSRKTSRLGSVRPNRIASSSIAGFAPLDVGVPSTVGSHRLSRFESPLDQRRRQSALNLESPQLPSQTPRHAFNVDNGLADSELDIGIQGEMDSDFELPMPDDSKVDPQWLAAGLEDEAFNFLTFVKDSIMAKQGQDEEMEISTVSFVDIVPVEDNTNIVAAQGFMHVLSLATKGLLTVKQEEEFGDIEIGIVDGLEKEVVVDDSGNEIEQEEEDIGEE